MRQDIKDLIKTRPSWQEMNPEETLEEPQVLRVEESICQMRERDPVLTDLFAAYTIAKREGDLKTAQTVWEMIDIHKSSECEKELRK